MPNQTALKPCAYLVVRYVPHPEREEFRNIGLFLHSPEEQYLDCLFTRDFGRVKRFHPHADLAYLRGLQGYFEQQIQEHEEDLPSLLNEMEQSLSHAIQLAPQRPVLASKPEEKLRELFARIVDDQLAQSPAPDTRMRIKQRLEESLRQAGVFEHSGFERRIPAQPLTHRGDPFHFDFGYRPLLHAGKPNGHLRLIHALSLHRDFELASVLSLTMGYIRSKQPAELTAVIDEWPTKSDKTAAHSARILRDAKITIRPLSEVDAIANSIHDELQQSASGGS